MSNKEKLEQTLKILQDYKAVLVKEIKQLDIFNDKEKISKLALEVNEINYRIEQNQDALRLNDLREEMSLLLMKMKIYK